MSMKLRIGDVIKNGGCEYVIDLVNQSRARGQPIMKIPRIIHDKLNDVEKTVMAAVGSKNASFSPYVDPDCVVAHIRRNGTRIDYVATADQHIGISPRSGPPPRRVANATEPEAGQNKQQNEETNMSKNKSTDKPERKPTAGRAAFIHKAKENGKTKTEAFEAVVAKGFDCSKAAFDAIWDAKGKSKVKSGTLPPKKKAAAKSSPPPKKTETLAQPVAAATTAEPVAAAAESTTAVVA